LPGHGFDAAGSSNAMPAAAAGGTWQLVQGVVLQRHLDRWIYDHSLIYDQCWPGQVDSRAAAMVAQCRYNRSTVWEPQPGAASLARGDPYVPAWVTDRDHRGGGPAQAAAGPAGGACLMDAQGDPQLTVHGQQHAAALGTALGARWRRLGLLASDPGSAGSCPPGTVLLASDGAQKNTCPGRPGAVKQPQRFPM
jgi:hypothetical protein